MFDVAGGVRCGNTSHSDVATAIGRTQPIRLRSRLRTTSAWQAGQAHWRLQDWHQRFLPSHCYT